MRVFVAQLDQTIGAFEENTQKILQSIEKARGKGADIVLFAEMAICGYPPEDLLLHPSFVEEMERSLQKIIEASGGLFVVVGLVRKEGGEKPLRNSAAIIHNKKLLGYHDKCLLPTYDVFDEMRYFQPGSEIKVWPYKDKKIGVTICEDIWQHGGFVDYTLYAKDPVADLMKLKPDLVLNLSASPYQFQKPQLRIKVVQAPAKSLRCPLIMCSQVGGMDQLVFDGYSLYIDFEGNIKQEAAGFKEDFLDIDLNATTPTIAPKHDPIADLYQALVLGVKDYFYKQGFKKGCLGLSGGIDSALVAYIAKDALGSENVLALGMPSRYSSSSSLKDALALANHLEIKFLEIPIETLFTSYLDLLEPHFAELKFDSTEENIQARIRGAILMAISNKLGYIVLSTGNKSELALGYCTLYGDMCGGLSVLSDVTKKQVYELAKYLNIPHSIVAKIPSAELRPNQKDTDSLPEYPIVDAVLQGYVEDLLTPEQISQKHKIPLSIVKDLIHKIHLAEYKRRQAAPGIRVSRKAFRIGRRYPIVQQWA